MLAAAASLRAQTTLGSAAVTGTARDESGAIVPGAAIVLIETARNLERETLSNDAGRFVFPTVPAGVYNVRVSKTGFQTYQTSGITVEVGQSAALEIVLKVGDVATTMSVAAEAALLQTESNTIGTVVDSARVEELPLNGRNFLQLALLAGGSNEAVGRGNVNQTGHNNRTLSVAGNQASHTGFLINGIVARGTRSAELTVNLSVASIDQFKVQQSFFMPDQGPNPGLVNVTTKGGGNQFHGQAFEFVRNEVFDARNFFAPGPEKLHRNQFGGAAGGPIVRNRLWFYGNYEGMREVTALSGRAYTPTQAMFGGDFNETGRNIFDPASFSAETGLRQPFANRVIPSARLNPVSRNLLRYYIPGSSLAQRPNNVFLNPRDSQTDDQYGGRVDYAINAYQSLFGQFIGMRSPLVNAGLFPLSGAFYPNDTHVAMVQHIWTLSPALVNTFRVGFARSLAIFSNEGKRAGPILNEIGIPNTLETNGVTGINLQEYTAFGRANGDLGNVDNLYQIDNGMNHIRGTHNFQLGVGIRYYRTWQQNANAAAHGNLAFQRNFTAQLQRNAQGQFTPQANTGDAFADFLLGTNTTGAMRGLPRIPYRFSQFMPYFQDVWKLRPNLTLNYGISWFKATVPNPQKWASTWPHGFNYETGLLTYAALGEIDPRVLLPDNNNFTPRLGVAWTPWRNTVIRAGAGLYYSDQQLGSLQWTMVAPPFNDSIEVNNGFVPVPQWVLGRNIFPARPQRPLDKNYAATVQGSAPFLFNEESRNPYMQQWNFSIQRTLGGSDMIELVYLGSSNHKLQSRHDYNQCRPTPDLRCNNATKPYPRYASLLRMDFPANSSYQAFIAKYDRRFGRGLAYRVEYTWAKTLSDVAEGEAQIAFCRGCEKGPTGFDVRHRGVVSAIYELPVGRGRAWGSSMSRAVDLLAGGWTATAIGTFQTGPAFHPVAPNVTASSFSDSRPNRICDGRDSGLANGLRTNGLRQFDTTCFVAPPTGFFGNSGRGFLNGPGVNNWDIGIQKFFPLGISENMRMQFRAEMFNAFNHAQFSLPVTNVASPNFGIVGGARQPRLIQLGLKLLF